MHRLLILLVPAAAVVLFLLLYTEDPAPPAPPEADRAETESGEKIPAAAQGPIPRGEAAEASLSVALVTPAAVFIQYRLSKPHIAYRLITPRRRNYLRWTTT